jgi:hypothetical protein
MAVFAVHVNLPPGWVLSFRFPWLLAITATWAPGFARQLFMRIRRRVPILLGVVIVIAAVILVVQLRKHAPPEAARLLPGADAFFYANLEWLRVANLAGPLPQVPHDPQYEEFIQATGFQFERDLDEAAFAVHYPTKTGPPEARFSEVLVGKIQGDRLTAYLHKLASSVDQYKSTDIYNIPLEGRTLRVAQISVDTVAASNMDDPSIIRGIIDRSRKLASPFGGPALLRRYYKHVPLASVSWGIFHVMPDQSSSSGPFGVSFLFQKPAVLVASLRYLGSVHVKAEAFTDSDEDAEHLQQQVSTFLNIFHSAETEVSPPGNDADMKQFLQSLKVESKGDRAVLTATVPTTLIRKLVAESPNLTSPAAQSPPASPQPAPRPVQKSHTKPKLAHPL